MIVLLAGPDGSGKSALTACLSTHLDVSGWEHFRPFRKPGAPVATPHERPSRGPYASVIKLGVLWFEAWARVPFRYAQSRRGLVIVERGWWDQAVDPRRYRLHDRAIWLVPILGRLLPRPDIAILLVGVPQVIHERKPELSASEIGRQLSAWSDISIQVAKRTVAVDTTSADLDETCDLLLGVLADAAPVRRWPRFGSSGHRSHP